MHEEVSWFLSAVDIESDFFLLVLKMKQVVKPLRNLPTNKPNQDTQDSQSSSEPEKDNRYVVDEGNFWV